MSDPNYMEIGTPEDRCIEECAELIKILCKVKRFGWDNFHPDHPDVSNRILVLQEIEDVERLCGEIKEALRGGEVKDKHNG